MPTHLSAKTAIAVLTGAMLLPLTTSAETFFFSFDTALDGNGSFTDVVTAEDFPGVPTFSKTATVINPTENGGATFTDFEGNNWIGSGGTGTPGHSSTYNPGSTGNTFTLTFDSTGLSNFQLRMDIRAGGSGAPLAFSDILFDTGAGLTSMGLSLAEMTYASTSQIGSFRPYTLDLSFLTQIENQSSVSLLFEIPDLGTNPNQSFRVDNIQVSAVPEPSSVVMLIGGMATLGLLRQRRR